jgi:hypothetical protein
VLPDALRSLARLIAGLAAPPERRTATPSRSRLLLSRAIRRG